MRLWRGLETPETPGGTPLCAQRSWEKKPQGVGQRRGSPGQKRVGEGQRLNLPVNLHTSRAHPEPGMHRMGPPLPQNPTRRQRLHLASGLPAEADRANLAFSKDKTGPGA